MELYLNFCIEPSRFSIHMINTTFDAFFRTSLPKHTNCLDNDLSIVTTQDDQQYSNFGTFSLLKLLSFRASAKEINVKLTVEKFYPDAQVASSVSVPALVSDGSETEWNYP